MDKKLQNWRDDGKHLPSFLKDFHDQKDLFKFLHEFSRIEDHEMIKDINWMQGHAYTIDIFLFIMARFGWTLQRNRSDQEFESLEDLMNQYTQIRKDKYTQLLLADTKPKPENKD